MSTDTPTKEDLIANAWASWREADYSWDGLAKKDWRDGKTLQDYWLSAPETGKPRSEDDLRASGELIEIKGQPTYHICHLPLTYADGTPTLKSTDPDAVQARMDDLIRARLSAAVAESEGQEDILARKARLNGAVCLKLDLSKEIFKGPLNLGCDQIIVSGYASFIAATFSGITFFGNATFSGNAYFSDATFTDYADFQKANFSGDAYLTRATFFRLANFSNAALSGNANFNYATFSGEAKFNSATFSGDAPFWYANFSREADFNYATFCGEANFNYATFSGGAKFNSATFSGDAPFWCANFSGNASLCDATFCGEASFQKATFSGTADFNRATFYQHANFNYVTFSGDAYFMNATFSDYTEFRESIFCDTTDFSSAKFNERLSFVEGKFNNKASFQYLTWPSDRTHHQRAFRETVFKELANFGGSGFRAFAAFDGARFLNGLRLDKSSEADDDGLGGGFEAQARRTFNNELKACMAVEDKTEREKHLEALEAGCRTLKNEMIKQSDKGREQLLYTFELLARREQTSTSLAERWASYAYDGLSDYGGSIWRPIAWFAGTPVVFAAIYYWLFQTGSSWSDDLLMASWASLSRMLPFGAFGEGSSLYREWIHQSRGPGWAMTFMVLGSIQSLLALILAFLFGLAIRRRFQIS